MKNNNGTIKMKMNNSKNTIKGFTLIEMMIVVAILGIVSAIAIPSYTEYVRKGKRTDAKVELLRIAQIQESYFVQNLSYAKDLTSTRADGGLGLGATVLSEQEQYEMKITTAPVNCSGLSGANACTGYTLTAEAKEGQTDDKCGDFTLTETGAKDQIGASTGYDAKKCWK